MRSIVSGISAGIGLLILMGMLVSGQDNSDIEQGRYIVEQVSMCGECHTPRNARGELDRNRWLLGAPIPVKSPYTNQRWAFQAPAIAGLPGWNPEEVVRILELGVRNSGKEPRSPMPKFRMNHEDAAAVVAYLQSLR